MASYILLHHSHIWKLLIDCHTKFNIIGACLSRNQSIGHCPCSYQITGMLVSIILAVQWDLCSFCFDILLYGFSLVSTAWGDEASVSADNGSTRLVVLIHRGF